jgi:hypothetical protein
MLRLAKLGDALMAVAISCRQYALGISPWRDTESVHKFLKFRRGGNVDFSTFPPSGPSISTTKVLSDGRDESAPAMEIRWREVSDSRSWAQL